MKNLPIMGETMTVEELVKALQAVPDQQAAVITDGCDCYGTAVAVTVKEDGDVLIERGNS